MFLVQFYAFGFVLAVTQTTPLFTKYSMLYFLCELTDKNNYKKYEVINIFTTNSSD